MTGYYTLNRKILMSLISGGSALVTVVVTSSLMKFFTDVIGMSPALYGAIFLVFSIWNGINDPIIGYWADRRPFAAGIGKYRPLIRWAIPVIGASIIGLLFASPDWTEVVTAAFLLVLLVIYEGAQTLLQVSFNAFRVNTFISMAERTQVQVVATYINQIPVFLGGMIPIWFLTGTFSRMAIVGVFSATITLGLVLCWVGSRFVKEDPSFYERMEVTRGLKELFRLFLSLIKDRVFLLFAIAFFLKSAATGNYFAGYLYYMDNVLNESGLRATIPDVLTGVGQMLTLPLIVLAVRRYGSRNTLAAGMLLAVVGHAALSLPINYWVAAITYIVILLGYGFSSAIDQPFGGLVIDHIELTTGKRQPGVVGGIMAVLLVPAASVQPLILSTLLSATGYDGSTSVQAPEVVRAIRIGTGLIPAIILLAGIAVMTLIPLSKEREDGIQDRIREKHFDGEQKADDITAE